MANGPIYVGVDIGGTKVAAGIVNEKGEIQSQVRVPMNSSGDALVGLAAVTAAVDKLHDRLDGAVVAAIGASSPGPLDPESGVVINPPNLPCWRNFPLKAEIQRAYGVPVIVDNDANAAGLAEALWGAGAGYRSVFYATIGTGIGTGIVLDGRLLHGRTGAAGEGGHTTIDYSGKDVCACGKTGCIETLASGPAIARRARARINMDPSRGKALLDLAGGSVGRISAETVSQAWRAGDALATEVLVETADVLTIWLGNVIDLLEPDVIVVGGGVGELMSNFFGQISAKLPQWSINRRCCEIPLVLAKYVADSGIAGGAALCLGKHNQGESAQPMPARAQFAGSR